MGLEEAGDLVLHIILSKIGPENTARVACVSKRLKVSASEDSLWSIFSSHDLNISTPLGPHGDPSPSFKAAYQSWRESFRMYPWHLVKRVGRCWDNLKRWLRLNFPEAEATLRKGATEEDLEEFESALKVKLPLPTRLLYRFVDGQEPSSSSNGLIGGYSVYSHEVNVYLLPLKEVIRETNETMSDLFGISNGSNYIVVAASATASLKLFFLDCTDGQLYTGTSTRQMLPCVPESLVRSVHDVDGDQQQDAMLLWLEEHGRRLQTGVIKVREEEKIKSISLFPEVSPLCSVAVTNGVQVRASSVFIPEVSNLRGQPPAYWYAYSIRMSLVPEGCFLNGRHHSSCQLYWRHWIIRADDEVIDKVNGEAVIGKYPLLQAEEEEFVYESCSSFPTTSGSIEGSFTFVPGSLRDPKGSQFEVKVEEFPLKLPDYIF
ncbi:F-box protein SKIP16 [Raphanus sativus]|uniref:F-box protein SKIP16 n=1 Tax=Raphanus sativus TaxID=3726 RepID=A0A6J0KUV0_RAPSA|nr:F-box protein SKIP16 [Raphanus sativus]KAJ4878897.1 F-box protein SKIP16 [Raphanus sativus]